MSKQSRFCVICGSEVQRARFRSTPEKTTCKISCRNKLIAITRKREYATGEKSTLWRGGQMKSQGYIYLYRPNHPHNHHGYVKRANLVMEAHLGRCMEKQEIAHHKNGIKTDDSLENLELMSKGDHQRLHTKERKERGAYQGVHKRQRREKNGHFAS